MEPESEPEINNFGSATLILLVCNKSFKSLEVSGFEDISDPKILPTRIHPDLKLAKK